MSAFYLQEGWYSSEQLAEVLEADQKMNNHLAKAIGELPEGYTLTTHKLNPESFEGVAGSVVAMTQDKEIKLTNDDYERTEWQGLTEEDLDFWGGELGLGELGKGVLRAVADHLKEKNT
jgi:hypothetical protein